MHTSIKLETPCEFINITPLNPLISKCQIKVCYVSDQPNRNKSIITKDTARQIANSLPGSPIVGYYNEQIGDFEEHNTTISISNGRFQMKDGTRPYGFVDLGARCWFQKFLDDGINEHEYLMTEGYLWTGQYPETKRILEKGNNQSMELDKNLIDAQWTKDSNGKPQFFIINEAIVSKLCILGEDCEPCFEGSNITNVQFSFEDSFKEQLFSMMNELKELLNKGGAQVFTTYAVTVGDSLWQALYSYAKENNYGKIEAVLKDGDQCFAVLKDANDVVYRLDFSVNNDEYSFAENVVAMENYTPAEEPQFSLADVEAFEVQFKQNKKTQEEDAEKDSKSDDEDASKDDKSKEDNATGEDEGDATQTDDEEDDKKKDKKTKFKKEEDKNPKSQEDDSDNKKDDDSAENEDNVKEDDEEEDKKKKATYSLDAIPEYVELSTQYSELKSDYDNLVAELEPLKQFKLETERKQKQDMIQNEFYMLSDEDKQDVVAHIDEYSLDEIESKLSVICVRNKVSFAALDNEDQHNEVTTYNLGGNLFQDESTPAWVQAVLDTAKTLN